MKRRNSDVLRRALLSLCESIDSPRSLSVWLCFEHNQEELLNLLPTDFADNDTRRVQLDYLITEYLQKYKGLDVSINPYEVALGKWRSAELQCLETNRRFREASLRPFTGRVDALLFRAQRKIASLLGPFDYHEVLADCKWGPGATFDLKREYATVDNKISQAASVTWAALPFFRRVVQSDPHWAHAIFDLFPEGPFSLTPDCFQIVRGSRFLTVPKSAKTDRCIAAEPTGNSFLQQGVSAALRRRLRRVGIRLDDQSINQKGALEAYSHGFATLDLSSASDTISREIVYHLLPIDWAFYLDSIRSPETLVEGSWVRTEKFASMGNAFCFDLETLIFWALSSSVQESLGSVEPVLVYGDDIIVTQRAASEVMSLLQFCGFTVNDEKSHIQGNFFESCGKHYHRSHDVTPVYQKELISAPSEFIRAHNRLWRLASRLHPDDRHIIRGACRVLANSYPLRPFPRIPEGCEEDGGFLRPLSEFSLDKNHGFRCHVLDFVPQVTSAHESAMYAYKLRRFRHHSRGQFGQYLGDHSSNIPTNPVPSGHSGNTTKGRWRTRVRWVSEMAAVSRQ